MSIARKVARNSIILVVGEVFRNLLSFVCVFVVARFLGAYDFGVINYAFAYLYFFEMVPRFGFDPIVGRELAKDGGDKALFLGNVILLRLALVAAGIVLSVLALIAMGKPSSLMFIVALASMSLFFTLQINYETVLRTKLDMGWAVLINLGKQCLYLALVLVGAYLKVALWYFVAATLIAGCCSLLAYKKASERYLHARLQWDKKIVVMLLKESWPIAISSLLGVVLLRVGVLFLEFFNGFEAVGKYAASYKLIESLSLIPSAWAMSLFPLMSQFFVSDPGAFKKIGFYGFKFMLVIGVPICITISFYAGPIVDLIYGKKYEGAETCLKFLAWSAVFVFPNYVLANLNFAAGKQRLEMMSRVACAALNIVLCLVLIPKWSYVGCAIALIGAEALYSGIVLFYLSNYVIGEEMLRLLMRLAVINLTLHIFFSVTTQWPFIFMVIVGLVGAGILFFLLRIFGSYELELMRKMLPVRKQDSGITAIPGI